MGNVVLSQQDGFQARKENFSKLMDEENGSKITDHR